MVHSGRANQSALDGDDRDLFDRIDLAQAVCSDSPGGVRTSRPTVSYVSMSLPPANPP